MSEIGKAYIQIIPSSQGLKGKLTEIMDGEATSAGRSAGSKISTALGGALKTAAGVTAAAVSAATAAVGSLAKAAVSSYANYEQLAGGVDKLFGAASVKVKQYAEDAYKTSGLSANAYMETATGFAAALIKSCGDNTYKAADLVEVAMKSMSDNVNIFGSDMQSVQNAYQGFAKQNYTMLDNLKLGYGGTKQEMERLIADANEYAESIGQIGNMSIDSFADVVRAIDLIQQKQHIAGTTTAEAMTTIEGSANATKAAWENVVTAIGRGDGIKDAIKGLADSIFGDGPDKGLLNQIIPRIQVVMEGIGTFIEQASPFITEKIPELINAVLPSILESAATLIEALASGLIAALPLIVNTASDIIMNLVDSLVALLPQIVEVGLQIIVQLATGLAQALPELIPTIVEVVIQIVQTLIDNVGLLIDAAIALITGLTEGLIASMPILIDALPQLITSLVQALIQNAPQLLIVGPQLIFALVQGILTSIPELLASVPQVLGELVNTFKAEAPKLLESGNEFIKQLVQGITNSIATLLEAGVNLVSKLKDTITREAAKLIESGRQFVMKAKEGFMQRVHEAQAWGRDLLQNFIDGIMSKFDALRSTLESAADLVRSILGFSEPEIGPLSNFHTFAPDMMKLFAEGIRDNTKLVTDQLRSSFDFSDVIMEYAIPEGGFALPEVVQNQQVAAPAADNGEPIILNAYFGQERIDTIIFEAIERGKYRMGGRV